MQKNVQFCEDISKSGSLVFLPLAPHEASLQQILMGNILFLEPDAFLKLNFLHFE